MVLALLDEGTLSQKEIAEKVGLTPARISQIKKDAQAKGLLDKRGRATQKGLEFIAEVDISENIG